MQSKFLQYILTVGIVLCIIGLIFVGLSGYRYWKFDRLYSNGDYTTLASEYTDSYPKSPEMLHNLGNLSYKQYIDDHDTSHLQKALDYYSASLAREEHPDTRYNYELIERLLQSSQNNKNTDESEDKQSQDSEEDTGTQEEMQEGKDNEGSSSGDASSLPPDDSRDTSDKQSGSTAQSSLTPQQAQELQAAQEQLKQEQYYNQQYFNSPGVNGQDSLQDVIDSMMQANPFFQSTRNSLEKDW